MAGRGYRFGSFELDLENGELLSSGARVRLAPQPFELLALLVRNPDRLVHRDEIIRHLWADTHIDHEQGLKSCVKQVRRALGESSTAPRFIETVPKRGYRFLAPVTRAPAARSRAPRTVVAVVGLTAAIAALSVVLTAFVLPDGGPHTDRITLAVLPFEDLSPDGADRYVSDGFTDELITRLANLEPDTIRVIARTSSSVYRDDPKPVRVIAGELSASHVLEGSVHRAGDRVRFTTRLVLAEDETPVWAGTYDRKMGDWLPLQSEISHAVVNALAGRLLPAVATGEGIPDEARYAYLKGLYISRHRSPEYRTDAREHLEEALRLAPDYALAHQALAQTWFADAFQGDRSPHPALSKARHHAERAIELDATLADARATFAMILWLQDWDWDGARNELEQAIASAPANAAVRQQHAMLLAAQGHHQRARIEIEAARALDPLSVTVSDDAAWIHFFAGDYGDAAAHARRSIELNPDSFSSWYCLSVALQHDGRLEEARDAYREMSRAAGVPETAVSAAASSGGRSVTDWWTDATREAGPALPDYERALIYLGRGRLDEAFLALEQSRAHLSGWITMIAVDPRLAPLRSDARYRELLDRMNL